MNDSLEIRVYKGTDGEFDLYEDEGDNYNYEKGKYCVIHFRWKEKLQQLIIGNIKGSYAGQLKKRTFNIVFVTEGNGVGIGDAAIRKAIVYTGNSIILSTNK